MKGVYQVERQPGGEIVLRKDGTAFKIRLRKNPGPSKPTEFLIMFRPAYRYISSLYPIGPGEYAFDLENVSYTLSLGSGSGKIAVTQPKAVEER